MPQRIGKVRIVLVFWNDGSLAGPLEAESAATFWAGRMGRDSAEVVQTTGARRSDTFAWLTVPSDQTIRGTTAGCEGEYGNGCRGARHQPPKLRTQTIWSDDGNHQNENQRDCHAWSQNDGERCRGRFVDGRGCCAPHKDVRRDRHEYQRNKRARDASKQKSPE